MMDDFGDRMKMYEGIEAQRVFMPRLPICVRIDGRAFHTFTRGMKRPYDGKMAMAMIQTMKYLVDQSNACIGYTQSDEISLILRDDCDPLFGGRISKLTSVLASIATAKFNEEIHEAYPDKPLAFFDCRCWQVPNRTEAANELLWREFDATKNSISMAARAYYSDKQLYGKNGSEKQDMLMDKGINWNDYPVFFKRGTYAQKKTIERILTSYEWEKLPEIACQRIDRETKVKRSAVLVLDMPIFSKVVNRAEVIFDGADPQIGE
jgi:tRNA(His) 5'-end guanylyltransferase